MNKFIKTSLVTVGLLGAITLNAWWCHHCGRNHGGACPDPFGCGGGYGCGLVVDSDEEDELTQNLQQQQQAIGRHIQAIEQQKQRRAQERENKVFGRLEQNANVAEWNRFVRKTQDTLANRSLRMVVGPGGHYQVIPEDRQLPQGFHLDVIPGQGQQHGPALPQGWERNFDPQLGCLGCDADW
ncbi:MAG: hypothetical protein LBE99_00070 [Puniceicoccales bacterium]|nr:hypothetical protein [Puniceicoccales bacterium]